MSEEKNLVPSSWSWRQSVIRTVIVVIIVQPWTIIIMEALSDSTVINCYCLWLDCLLVLTLTSTYCAATLEASTCHLSVCLCALLCVTAPPAGAHPLFEPSRIFCCSSKWHAGSVELLSLLVFSATYKRQPFCTDNTEPRRKACQIIFITSSSSSLSLSTSS